MAVNSGGIDETGIKRNKNWKSIIEVGEKQTTMANSNTHWKHTV